MGIRFRLSSVIASAALVLTSIAFGAPAASAATPANTQSAAKGDVAELLKSLNDSTGLIGTSWWQGAVALSTLETYQQTTGDTTDALLPGLTFAFHSSGSFEDNFDDDTAWWALVWLQYYDITHDSAYLRMAETDANFIHQDWTSACGGGVWWQRSPHYYKNAIANELFLELTAWLHNTVRGDTKYLSWAKAEWSWFSRSGMIGKNYLVTDGPNAAADRGSCVNTSHGSNEKIWTYNQGVILAGLAQLYKATRTKSYLTEAERIANAAISHFTVKGVLTEDCKNGCGTGSQSFKGIFVRDLKVLAVTAKTKAYNSFFTKQAQSIVAKDTNAHHQVGMYWAGPRADLTSWSEASGIDALVASLKLP
jgi:Glycosyl hydrolase family 76